MLIFSRPSIKVFFFFFEELLVKINKNGSSSFIIEFNYHQFSSVGSGSLKLSLFQPILGLVLPADQRPQGQDRLQDPLQRVAFEHSSRRLHRRPQVRHRRCL